MNYLQEVEKFMITAEQPVVDKPSIMPEDRNKLRIALIFEELKEYAKASGKLEYFNLLCLNSQQEFQEEYWDKDITYIPKIDLVEQFDACIDMQYVLSGTIIENGFKDIFNEGFEEVQRSNMSKFCNTEDEAIETLQDYAKQGIETCYDSTQRPLVIKRLEDGKVLKSINYSPANLKPIIDETNKEN